MANEVMRERRALKFDPIALLHLPRRTARYAAEVAGRSMQKEGVGSDSQREGQSLGTTGVGPPLPRIENRRGVHDGLVRVHLVVDAQAHVFEMRAAGRADVKGVPPVGDELHVVDTQPPARAVHAR
mgnify:FL=1